MVILVFCLIYKTKETFPDRHFIHKNASHKCDGYRLGDIVRLWNDLKYQSRSGEYLNSIPRCYPHSIGDGYLRENTAKKPNNLPVLFKIIDKRIKGITGPDKNTVVVHLRIGDVIGRPEFILDPKIFAQIIDTHPSIQKKKYVLVYNNHYVLNKNQIKLNMDYLNKIRDVLRKRKIAFVEYSDRSPDDDFLFMCKSHYFIGSGGGFSTLIKKYIKSRGGDVVD